ncbi:hypothetical protein DH2020_044316 [Rehmannia glutinosa]|uniref:Uncharacterized protein n=1 Tax=Rehmannia glutinosa TaxID=99300 RepID=A0ABR0UH93_REHGL
MKEVEVSTKFAGSVPQINLNFHPGHQFASPNIVPFKSFSSLLAEDEEDDHNLTLLSDIKNHREQIDQIITFHCDTLRHSLAGALHREAEERASKKLKEKDLELEARMSQSIELEKMVEDYKAEAESLKTRVLYLEQTKESLRLSLKDAIARVAMRRMWRRILSRRLVIQHRVGRSGSSARL